MRVIFFGTSEFAIPAVEKVWQSNHHLLAVVSKSDRKAGRGRKEQPTPVSEFVRSRTSGIELIQPPRLKDPDLWERLQKLKADIFLVASFPILPMEIVSIPELGCLNLHPSLLPQYRGAAPIQRTLLAGEKETGISTFFIGGKIDAGGILLQKRMEIYPDDNFGSLHDRLAEAGADLMLESLDIIAQGGYTTIHQDDSFATPAPKIKSSELRIDWNDSAHNIHNKVRAFSPSPGAYTELNGRRLKIFTSQPSTDCQDAAGAGRVIDNELIVSCGEGSLKLLEIQIEGKVIWYGRELR